MKKLLIILPLIVIIAGCVVIDERYAGPRVRVEPDDYYYDYSPGYYDDYYPSGYSYYSPYSIYPNSWFGLGMWNPFYYYGLYSSYWGGYGGYYGGYYGSYYPSRYGRIGVTRRQLKDWRKYGGTTGRKIRVSSGTRGRSSGRSTVSRSSGTRTRSISSRGSSGTRVRSTSSSRGSSGTKIKKK